MRTQPDKQPPTSSPPPLSTSLPTASKRFATSRRTFEPIEPPWQAIRAWIPADDDESGTDTPELWDQSPDEAWKAPEIDLGDGRTLVLEYT